MTIILVNAKGTAVVTPNPIAVAALLQARAAFDSSIVSTQ